ncbi:lichenase-like [Silene latifolia]|uniref:lichenase-like n=1 Tax=Silene latifolia TaxID=37657 RepID=UPI003D7802A9
MASYKMVSLLALGLLFAANLYLSEAQVGVCYGTKGNNLPTPQEVVGLFAANNISKVRLLEPNKDILTALKGKNVEVLLGFPNGEIAAFNPSVADKWVADNVKPYVPDVKIKYIVYGTELSRNSFHNSFTFTAFVNMKALQDALKKQGIEDIKITTSLDSSVLIPNPIPSASKLFPESENFLEGDGVLKFISEQNAPLMVNMYPYYQFIMRENETKLEFALFTSEGNVLSDGKLGYQNKFDAMLDAFYTVIEKRYPKMEIVVAETGWPSAGGVEASLENAKTYVTNLVQHVNKGTQRRPNKPIQVYLNLFDENQRDTPEVEKHFGLFTSDKKIKFPVAFSSSA